MLWKIAIYFSVVLSVKDSIKKFEVKDFIVFLGCTNINRILISICAFWVKRRWKIMSKIQISNLTFQYPGRIYPIFKDVNLVLDTDWKLRLTGRNGKGKTTFLNYY